MTLLKDHNDEIELWRKSKRFPDYLVSSWGRVFSLYSKTYLKGSLHNSRSNYYRRFQLGKTKIMGHVLVAEVYPDLCGKMIKKGQVNHLDWNTLNNRATNLKIETQSDNIKHSYLGRKIFDYWRIK